MKPRRPHPAAPKPAKTALVQIEKPIYGGSFLARLDGKATFVPLTLPGERARVRILEDKRSYATAEPDAIIESSPNRIEPRCPHFGACGGCNYQHGTYETQLALKQQILLETFQRAGVQPPDQVEVLAGEPWAYRNRIRLAFDPSGHIGYRSRRSHSILPIRECPISAPLLVKAGLDAAEILRETRFVLKATELSLFCDTEETALLATISVSDPAIKAFDRFASEWKKRIPELAGIECVRESSEDENPKQLARWGAESILYRAAGFDYRVDHSAFFQVNRHLIDTLVRRAISGHQGNLAWDLFAGVGLFARQLAEHFEEVVAVESAPAATLALTVNLEGTNSRSFTTDTLSFLKAQTPATKPDLIIADPPRTGLGPKITSLLGKIVVPALVYVSCDPATLARDLKALIAAGYSPVRVALIDLFPQTFHVETVVTLRKP